MLAIFVAFAEVEAVVTDKPLRVPCTVMCGQHLDVWLSAGDAKSVKKWAAILIPVYALSLSALLAFIALSGAPPR